VLRRTEVTDRPTQLHCEITYLLQNQRDGDANTAYNLTTYWCYSCERSINSTAEYRRVYVTIFTARRNASVVCAMSLCPYVCRSVCRPQAAFY